jgi:hypothetical protein
MSSDTYHQYDPATGLFTGRSYSPLEHAQRNTPAGLSLYRAGPGEEIDALSQCIAWAPDDFGALSVPVLTDYQPPAPADDEWRSWAWSSEARRWLSTPTLAALKRDAGAPILASLQTLDSQSARPLAEIVQATALGEAAPAESLQRLREITAEKEDLRRRLAAITASTSTEELAASQN